MSGKERLFEEQVERLIAPLVEKLGLELVAVEVAGEPAGTVVRVYLDEPGGIDVDTLAEASGVIDPVLERELPIERRYRLEVSSPGLERPLKKQADFERFVGERAHVRTEEKIEGRRNFTGTIEGVDDGEVRIRLEDREVRIPVDSISRARLVAEI
ncbi:MAG: ribosome maturation factor RimP [Actinobacteria bacterium]|nr:MAG: ribosome maturation factor RimP [Actinomycetota bacterium]